ncbi:MAG: PIN domain-containing protein, partial [Desulfobacteria bacterium]
MVLVDTSIWVTHLRQGTRRLEKLLMDAEVMCHSFIIGELACGNLKNRNEILSLLQSLPMTPTIEFDEFLFFIDRNHLMGKGVGFVDVHLLASAQLAGVPLWTADKRLK